MDISKIAIIGPGRLGTALAYKFGRDGKKVSIYYHDLDLCRDINTRHINPKHLTDDLAAKCGGAEVPKLSDAVFATNDLEWIIKENDFVILAITMTGLQEILNYIKPFISKENEDLYNLADQGPICG